MTVKAEPDPPTSAPGTGAKLPEKTATAFFLLVLLILVSTTFIDNFDTNSFHEELRVLYHLDPARTNDKDYAGQLLAQLPQPILYRLLTDAAVGSGVDLAVFHRLLGAVCTLLLLAGAAASGWRIGGALGATLVAVLIAAQPIYNYQISSATPHAFAFPLLMWGLACLLYDRPYWLAGLTVLSGLLYPPVSPALGLALFCYLVIARKAPGRRNSGRLLDVLVIGVTAALSLFLLWRQLSPIEGYGAPLPPGEKVEIYPENGPSGRHFHGVFEPLSYVRVTTMDQLHEALPFFVLLIVPLCIVAVAGAGLYHFRHRPRIFRPLVSFVVPSALLCVLITLLRPYIAYRFLLYPLFTILPLLFVGGLLALCHRYRAVVRYPAAAAVAVMAPLVFAVSDLNGHRPLKPLKLTEPAHELMGYLETLPADSLIVTWPGRTETSLIPYVAGRPVLVNFKAHYPVYEGYVENMRLRMFDVIDAYLAQDRQPLIRLHCRWHADYFVVEQALASGNPQLLTYFEPFRERIREQLKTVDSSQLTLLEPPAEAVVFSAGPYTVLNLATLSEGATCPDEHRPVEAPET